MIKIKLILITFMLSISLVGCANAFQPTSERNEQSQTLENMTQPPDIKKNNDRNTPAALSDDDFIVKNEETFIELGGNYENLITNEEIVNFSPLNEKHVYDTYNYENFIITASPTVDNIVSYISLVTSKLETSRGIRIEDSITDVFKKYGPANRAYDHKIVYHYDYKIITFYVDKDGKVTNIILEMI